MPNTVVCCNMCAKVSEGSCLKMPSMSVLYRLNGPPPCIKHKDGLMLMTMHVGEIK